MNRRTFLFTGASLTAGALTLRSQDRPLRPANLRLAEAPAPIRFEFVPDKLALPSGVQMRHGHGLCLDRQGRIYFTYEADAVEAGTRVLVRFAPDGTAPELLGKDNALAPGTPHGLSYAEEADGQGVLYHANNHGTIHKTTLEGEVLWTCKWPSLMGNYKPTDTAVLPGGKRVFVADGYGSNMIHTLNTADGVYAGKSWGGTGKREGELSCPHAIAYDPRRELLLVCDRSNRRLVYYTPDGFLHSIVEEPRMKAPCNTDFRGDLMLVPNLDGPTLIFDRDNRVVAVIEVAETLGGQGFKHPHDAIWLASGDLAICTWNPGRLGYWRRLPA